MIGLAMIAASLLIAVFDKRLEQLFRDHTGPILAVELTAFMLLLGGILTTLKEFQ